MSILTFLTIQENLKLLLGMQNVPYIHDAYKERNAINKFTWEGFTPDYVLELIGKLIEIKRHSKLGKELFWKGCAINLSDAYSYRVKIETVYPTIAPDIISPSDSLARQSKPKDGVRADNSNKASWQSFLTWSKILTPSSQEKISTMTSELKNDGKLILITGNPSDNLAQIITTFFNDAGISTVFKKTTPQQE